MSSDELENQGDSSTECVSKHWLANGGKEAQVKRRKRRPRAFAYPLVRPMKDFATAVEHVMWKERDDHGFHVGIFEQAHAASAYVKAACIGIHAEPKVRIVPAADYGMEMVSSVRSIHGISQRLGLFVGNQFIVGPMNDEHRRFVLMDIKNRTRATHEISIARGFRSQERSSCRAQSCQIAHAKQINAGR